MDVRELQMHVSAMVQEERKRQNRMYGIQRHELPVWLVILIEEVGEAAQAMQKGMPSEKSTDAADLLTELIQVTAVAQAMAEQVYEGMHGRGSHERNDL